MNTPDEAAQPSTSIDTIDNLYSKYWHSEMTGQEFKAALESLVREREIRARLKQLDELIDIEPKQFMHWSQKDIAFFFEKVGKIYRGLEAELTLLLEKETL